MKNDAVEIFEQHREHLNGLVYRITSSVSEAEDITQETLIKWLNCDQSSIDSPGAWLTRVASNMALDYLSSARVQRQSYVGPWLPDPYVANESSPEEKLEIDESISMALLLVLEQLNPAERAAYILHDIFAYSFEEVSKAIGKSNATCRKLATRARQRIKAEKEPSSDNAEEHKTIILAFFDALKQGQVNQLQRVLSHDVVFHSDGGGKAISARRILSGNNKVLRFITRAIMPSLKLFQHDHTNPALVWFNGSPGYVLRENDIPVTAYSFIIENGLIKTIYAVRNPDKLKFFNSYVKSDKSIH